MVTSQSLGASLPYLPPNLLKKYNSWILTNPSTVSQVESALRSLTYLVPGSRLNDNELASESIYALTNLVSLYHDTILARSSGNGTQIKGDPHSRYTKFWVTKSLLYKYFSRLLKTVQYTELLWEMIGRRRGGERGRWRVVVFLESIKAIIRLCLCWLTGGRWVLSSPLPDREEIKKPTQEEEDANEWMEDEANRTGGKERVTRWENGLATPPLSESEKLTSSSEASQSSPPRSVSSQTSTSSTFSLPRTGLDLPPLPAPSQISSYLAEKTLFASDVRPAPTLLHRLASSQSQIAELLYILRPVVFAILMHRVAGSHVPKTPDIPSMAVGRPSWKRQWMPWLVGLGMEWGSRQLMKRDIERRVPGGMRGLSNLEREEMKRRGYGLGWWAMRGAFYETFTRKYVLSVSSKLKSVPLLDIIGGIVDDYEYLWDNYYFATSSM